MMKTAEEWVKDLALSQNCPHGLAVCTLLECVDCCTDMVHAAVEAETDRCEGLQCDTRDFKFRKGWEALQAAIREGEKDG